MEISHLLGFQSLSEEIGDIALGCDSGTLIILDIKKPPKPLIMMGKLLVHDQKPQQPEGIAEKKILTLPQQDEPITHIIEIGGKKDFYGFFIVSTLNGWLYLVNHIERQILKKYCLKDIPLNPYDLRFFARKNTREKEDNVVYFMGAYSGFNYEVAPFIIIHDRLDGLYMLHFTYKSKTPILSHRGCQQLSISSVEPDSYSEEEESSDSDSEAALTKNWYGVFKPLGKIKSSREALKSELEPNWQLRFQNCQFCNYSSLPQRDGVVIHRNARQMLVVQSNCVQVINYEANCEIDLQNEQRLYDIRSPLSYDFSFEKVASEAKLLAEQNMRKPKQALKD